MTNLNEITKVFKLLETTHKPTMLEELGHYTAYQMLVMTLLSARAKDSTTIPIVKEFFAMYPNPQDVIKLPIKELEKWFYKIGFYKVKSRNVNKLSHIIIEKYKGKVPQTREELTSLPGVGRKTANCILAYKFKIPAIAVDIHVHRIANRLGWIKTKKETITEQELMKIIPKNRWINVNRLLVGHGQTICAPRNPQCSNCNIRKFCNYFKTN